MGRDRKILLPLSHGTVSERRWNNLNVFTTFILQTRPESGLDFLICAMFARQRSFFLRITRSLEVGDQTLYGGAVPCRVKCIRAGELSPKNSLSGKDSVPPWVISGCYHLAG